MTVAVVVALALGTYALRISGFLLNGRVAVPAPVQRVLSIAAATLLAAVVATSALTQNGGFTTSWARTAGVGLALVLVWRRVPFVIVIVMAAGTTAILRFIGVP